MELMNFIVLQMPMREGHKTHTVNGMVLMPLDKPVPVIVAGQGCIGIGTVTQLTIRSSSTDIEFELVTKISDAEKKAYYNLYRNQISGQQAEDKFDTSAADVVIPGAMTNLNSRSKKSQKNNYDKYGSMPSGRSRRPALSDLLDDDEML